MPSIDSGMENVKIDDILDTFFKMFENCNLNTVILTFVTVYPNIKRQCLAAFSFNIMTSDRNSDDMFFDILEVLFVSYIWYLLHSSPLMARSIYKSNYIMQQL